MEYIVIPSEYGLQDHGSKISVKLQRISKPWLQPVSRNI